MVYLVYLKLKIKIDNTELLKKIYKYLLLQLYNGTMVDTLKKINKIQYRFSSTKEKTIHAWHYGNA